MARARKRAKARNKERAERREVCEVFRAIKAERAELLALYAGQVRAGAVCPACGRPLHQVGLSVSIPTPLGFVHEDCA